MGPGILFVISRLRRHARCGSDSQRRRPWRAGSTSRWTESFAVGVGMCGRAEMAFILASLGLSLGAIDSATFSVLIITTFILNIFTIAGLKVCAMRLKREGSASDKRPEVEEWP